MYRELAKRYIKNLTPNDIKKYASSINIDLNSQEVNIIFNFLLLNYEELLNRNDKVLLKLKDKLSPSLYNTVISLYEENKNKYL